MEGSSLGVRKGAWTEEEDILLKKCIGTHGEGKWHQVPAKAGHSHSIYLLLWSLIAGRIPGRTANDVKNYWNTHLLKKFKHSNSNQDLKQNLAHDQNPSDPNNNVQINCNINVIKPRPRTLCRQKSFVQFDHHGNNNDNDNINNNNNNDNAATTSNIRLADEGDSNYNIPSHNDDIMWWEDLIMNDYKVDEQQQQAMLDSVNNEEITLGKKGISNLVGEGNKITNWDQLFCDVELGNVFNSEPDNRV
ncbi:hypothetical protein COLO4_15747 [Corchorus olitorius]|uniref:Uncharacterized protein n=1 Tax=Corchorus olitorius TaxID=93759 RepID=A0A1R3JLE6_9ROSI|nr:hypothetical protein COLO4_15747 [Corchorus olitorius]